MKKIFLALLLSAFFLSGCGTKDDGNSLPVVTNQPSRNTSNTEQMEEPEQMENTEQTEVTKQAEKEDVSGIYTDKQGTTDVYSQLTLALQLDGTYTAEISVYRVSELEGTAVWEGDVLRFTSEDPYVLADISVTGGMAEVVFITGAVGFQTGDVYSFPDGAPDESAAGQAGDAAFQPNFSDEIATEISYAEEQEKEIEKKQEEAITQLEMNLTAAEMYQLWDNTLNIVWGLLEANLNEADMEVLRKEEREWIAFKDAEVQAAGQECEGGSIQPSVEATTAADLTKARVYELAEYEVLAARP
ncbi:MAG: lysozyme inhibitor LprI family protein [Lachnospiraceae bacterium]|nr:lysozyme inhibitor LprI family protein [Lachnospiraceae bacterium]